MSNANWTFMLADAAGNNLCELTTASGRRIEYKRNSYAEAQFSISHEDEAAAQLWNALLNTGVPTLKCYRNQVLRFNGYLAPFSEDAEEQSMLNAVFRSPFGRIIGEGSNRGRFVGWPGPLTLTSALVFSLTDAGAIARTLLDSANSNGTTGLATTTTNDGTKPRDRTYPVGTNIGEAIVNLTNVIDGFDFSERFVAQGSTLALFDIFASQGKDQPAARFEYGADTLSNCRQFSRTVEPPINVAGVIGGDGMRSVKIDQPSIDKYGNWTWLETQSDVTEQATLDDKAWALLRPNPVKVIGFVPEYGLENCPKYFDDFGMGDTIHVFARRGALNEDTPARVNGALITIDESGFETAEIVDPETPEGERMIRAQLQVEVAAP